jgi:hypothetical protein
MGPDNYPIRDYWSNPVVYESSWPVAYISPIYQAIPSKDPVVLELERLQVPISKVTNEIMGVQLTRKQFEDYQIAFGEVTPKKGKNRLNNLHDAMQRMINSTKYVLKYTDGTDEFEGSRSKALKTLEQGYKVLAQKRMFELYPELKDAVEDLADRKKAAMTDQAAAEQEEQQSPIGLGGALSLPQ